jgi:cell division GTPase FtsZ
MTLDESMDDEVKVTIIATGFKQQSREEILKQPKRDMLGRPVMRRESENFITRGIKKDVVKDDAEFTPIEEDLETPAFIRRSLNKEAK